MLFVAFFLFINASIFAQSKPAKAVEVKAKAVAKTRGSNPNIVTKDEQPSAMPTPPSKGGEDKNDKVYCSIDFDNWTNNFVDMYVDGYYQGTLGPFSKTNVIVLSGYTSVYAVTSNETKEWVSQGDCSGDFNFKLTE